jgi:RimJ/RimL family protein N-acetyltransferase
MAFKAAQMRAFETDLRVFTGRMLPAQAKEARALPSMQGVDAIPAQLIELQDGRHALLRPATKDDIEAIGAYITRLSGDDRSTRYMGTVTVDYLTSPERLARLYDDTLDYRQHAAFIVELDGEIIGVAHAFRMGEDGTYEVSFSRRSDLRGQGIGRHLMQMLIDWGAMCAKAYYATTYRNENPRMRALFDRFGFAVKADPDDPQTVIYSASLADLVRRGHISRELALRRSSVPDELERLLLAGAA